MFPVRARRPFATGFAQPFSEGRVKNLFFEGRGQLRGTARSNEIPRRAIDHRFRNSADIVSHDWQTVGGSFEINQAEAFNAPSIVDAGHRENIGPVINRVELVVWQIAEEAHGEVRL